MKLYRFFADFNENAPVVEVGDSSFRHRIRDVLRLREGDMIILCGKDGLEATAKITAFGDGVEAMILSREKISREPVRKTTLYASLIKGDHFELAAEKAVEAGISRLVPLHSERTEKFGFKEERIRKITQEAAEQSGRAFVPELGPVMSLPHALQISSRHSINVFFDAKKDFFSKKLIGRKTDIGVFVGPEGGWSPHEREMAKNYATRSEGKVVFAGLGDLTLRSETAMIVASFLVCHSV